MCEREEERVRELSDLERGPLIFFLSISQQVKSNETLKERFLIKVLEKLKK